MAKRSLEQPESSGTEGADAQNQPSLRQLAINWRGLSEMYFRDSQRGTTLDRKLDQTRGSMLEQCASQLLEAIELGVPIDSSSSRNREV